MGIFKKKAKDDKENVKDVKKTNSSIESENANLNYSTKGNVLISPITTEKTHSLAKEGKYAFSIKRDASKRNVKYDIEKEYEVNVEKINIIKIPAKRRTIKHDKGYQSVGKKAIVTLKKGEKIALFETA